MGAICRRGLLVLAMLVANVVPRPAAALTVDEFSDDGVYHVTKLDIEGVGFFTARSIRDSMLSAPPPWYKPWQRWTAPVEFNREIFRSDLERIQMRLRESGHYEARIQHELITEKDELHIRILIEEGPAAEVENVQLVAGDFELTPAEEAQLRRLMPLEVGEVFTQEHYDVSRKHIEVYYLERGWAYVDVAKAAIVDTETERVEVTYTITRGPAAVFGTTTIDGQKDVATYLIEREIRWTPGEAYDPRKIDKTQANLFGLDLFRSVTVAPSNLEAKSGVVDMAIHVVEGPPRSIRIGVGYGLEDQARGQIQWQHNNFFGGGRQLGFRIKASMIEQSVEGEFRQPYFLHPDQTLVVPLTQARENEPGFTVYWIRLAPRIERKLLESVRGSIGYNIEYDKLIDVPLETQMELGDYRDEGFVSSLVSTLERNTTSDLFDPHEGSIVNLSVEVAGGPFQGNYSFYRASIEGRRYIEVLGSRVIAGRLRFGAGDGFGQSDDLPLFRRFFSGGINSIRGYQRYKLGPLTSEGNPIGGRSLMEGSLEFRTPIWRELGGVVFFEGGAVDLDAFHYDPSELRYAAGPGIRYRTPVGPLRLDIGFPLNPEHDSPSWQLQFSIGQAF